MKRLGVVAEEVLGDFAGRVLMGRVLVIGAGPTLAKTTLGLGAVKIEPQRQNIVKQNKSLVVAI